MSPEVLQAAYSDHSFLQQTFHEHLVGSNSSADHRSVTEELELSSKPVSAAQLHDVGRVCELTEQTHQAGSAPSMVHRPC